MKIGLIRPIKAASASAQRKSLIEYGVSERKIYDVTKGEDRADALNELRGKSTSLCVFRFSVLATDRRDLRVLLALLEDKRPWTIEESSTGRRAVAADDLLNMVADAMDDWAGDRIRLSKAELKKAGAKGAKKRWGHLKKTPSRTAAAIWRDWVNYPTVEDALKHPDMAGWTRRTAYLPVAKGGLGPRGAPAGPAKRSKT